VEIIDDVLFSREIETIESTRSSPCEEITSSCSGIFSKHVYQGGFKGLWTELQAKAKKRATEWSEQGEQVENAGEAKEELEKGLEIAKRMYRSLERAHKNGEVLGALSHKRKIDETVEQVEKATKVLRRVK
jgi:hypothetical protein